METPQQGPEVDASSEVEPEALVIATAPLPTTPEAVSRVLERFVREVVPPIFDADNTMDVRGLDLARVTAHPLAGDLLGIDIDLAGVEVTFDATVEEAPPLPELPEFGTEVARADARVAEVRVRGLPVRIQGAEVEASITAAGVHVDWAEDDRGQLALAMRQGMAGGEAVTVFPVDTLLIDVSARQREVVDALVSIVTESGESQGIHLSDVDLELTQAGPRGAHLRASGKVRRGFLRASLLFTTEAQLGDDLKLQLINPRLTSRNPLIGLLLLAVRSQIREELKDPIDLRDLQLDPLKLADAQFEVGERLRLRLQYD
ncbi:hypothetical protein C5E10_01100 [Pseudoclavibacter sp. RFBG4]|uniref:hypothetical protein n=1 Tax=Pseudoclavibacter sp. RFBG4 TaxID=2080575 RepID=UPI000CE7E10D|nr:hypothetical protein [Pseudoclavibacter sp. RFBG4]PPG36290.1 hypothetical protein C5E10_01100 [Pseudoclavibacter sp. RFBG4]